VRFPDTCIHACIHARYTCTRAERRDGETGLKSPRKSPSLRSLPYVLPAGGSRGGAEREKSLPTAAGSSMTMTRADSLSKHAVVNVCSRFMPDVATSPLRGFASLFRRRLLFGYRVNTGRQSPPPSHHSATILRSSPERREGEARARVSANLREKLATWGALVHISCRLRPAWSFSYGISFCATIPVPIPVLESRTMESSGSGTFIAFSEN
jgi:hypothetical protein